MSWEVKELGDLLKISKGKKYNEVPFDKSKHRYINIEDLHGGNLERYTNDDGVIVNKNDIIIAWDGANAGKVGVGFTGVIGSTLARLSSVSSNIDSRYVFWYLESKNEKIKSQRTGATIPHINGSALKELQIPLPSLPIQKKIADILDKADALRKKDQQLLQKYDELAQAVFISMFGDPVKNEKGWEVKKLGECIENIVAGSSYGGEDKVLDEDELGVLKVSAVTSGTFRPDQYKAVNKKLLTKDVIKVRKGDLLFSRANTRELVGATCIVDKDYDDIFLPDKLWRIDLNKKTCNGHFIKSVLTQKSVRYELNKTATGTSGSMLNISMQKLKDLQIIVPEIAIQQQFEKMIVNLKSIQSAGIDGKHYSEALFQSLLKQAFKGELIA